MSVYRWLRRAWTRWVLRDYALVRNPAYRRTVEGPSYEDTLPRGEAGDDRIVEIVEPEEVRSALSSSEQYFVYSYTMGGEPMMQDGPEGWYEQLVERMLEADMPILDRVPDTAGRVPKVPGR